MTRRAASVFPFAFALGSQPTPQARREQVGRLRRDFWTFLLPGVGLPPVLFATNGGPPSQSMIEGVSWISTACLMVVALSFVFERHASAFVDGEVIYGDRLPFRTIWTHDAPGQFSASDIVRVTVNRRESEEPQFLLLKRWARDGQTATFSGFSSGSVERAALAKHSTVDAGLREAIRPCSGRVEEILAWVRAKGLRIEETEKLH